VSPFFGGGLRSESELGEMFPFSFEPEPPFKSSGDDVAVSLVTVEEAVSFRRRMDGRNGSFVGDFGGDCALAKRWLLYSSSRLLLTYSFLRIPLGLCPFLDKNKNCKS